LIRRGIKYSVLIFAAIIISARAGDRPIEPGKAIPQFLKIITYDEHFNQKNIEEIVIMAIYNASRPKSYEQYLETEKYFGKNKGIAVKGVKIRFKPIMYVQADSALKSVSGSNYNMILVTDIGEDNISELARKTRASKVRSFSLCPEYVLLGLSISVDPARKSKAILLNLESSKQEGSKFGAHLLKICEIY